MKLDIRDIPAEGTSLELSVDEKTVKEVVGGGPRGLHFLLYSPLKARLNINPVDSMIVVDGSLNAKLSFDCSRCLREFDYTADQSFTLYFVNGTGGDKGLGEGEGELTKEDVEVNHLEDFLLDTTELVLEQFALSLPMQPLCAVECKGLCPRCGSDLNHGPCGCKQEEKVDPRFACLKGFKVE
jgi:uncharacterized protein